MVEERDPVELVSLKLCWILLMLMVLVGVCLLMRGRRWGKLERERRDKLQTERRDAFVRWRRAKRRGSCASRPIELKLRLNWHAGG